MAPGPIDTGGAGRELRRLYETVEYSPSRMTPMGRLGLPIEVAHAVPFLGLGRGELQHGPHAAGHRRAVSGVA